MPRKRTTTKGPIRDIVEELRSEPFFGGSVNGASRVTVKLSCGHFKTMYRGQKSRRLHCDECKGEGIEQRDHTEK